MTSDRAEEAYLGHWLGSLSEKSDSAVVRLVLLLLNMTLV